MVEIPFMCFDYQVMTPGRFELAITAVKGQCHSPLDQGAKNCILWWGFIRHNLLKWPPSLHSFVSYLPVHGLLWCRILLLRCSNFLQRDLNPQSSDVIRCSAIELCKIILLFYRCAYTPKGLRARMTSQHSFYWMLHLLFKSRAFLFFEPYHTTHYL